MFLDLWSSFTHAVSVIIATLFLSTAPASDMNVHVAAEQFSTTTPDTSLLATSIEEATNTSVASSTAAAPTTTAVTEKPSPLSGFSTTVKPEPVGEEWSRYVNPFIRLAFKYPPDWILSRSSDNGGWWGIDLYPVNTIKPELGGYVQIQIHPAEKDEQITTQHYMNKVIGSSLKYEPYGDVMGVEAVASGGTINFYKDGYRFNVETRDISSKTLREFFDTFVFVPPPLEVSDEEKSILQRETWEEFEHPHHPISFEYPPGWWIPEQSVVDKDATGLHVVLREATHLQTGEITLFVIRSNNRIIPELLSDWVIDQAHLPEESEPYHDVAGVPAFLGATREGKPVVHFGSDGYWYLFVVTGTDLSTLDSVLETVRLSK